MSRLIKVIFSLCTVLCLADAADKKEINEYVNVKIQRIPMLRVDILSDDENHLEREMTDSTSIFSLEMSLQPFHKRWSQFAVVLLRDQPWRVTSTDIGCPGRGGLCTDEQVTAGRELHLQLTKSDCDPEVARAEPKRFKLKLLQLSYTVRTRRNQWRSVRVNLTDVLVDDPCNVDSQPATYEVRPTVSEFADCASSQPLTRADPFRGFYMRDGEFVNTTWCEHSCTCRNGNLLCKPLVCSTKYNPNKERALWAAGECCQIVEPKAQFQEAQCRNDESFQWPQQEDSQRKLLVQLFRMPLWTVPYVVMHRPAYMSICMASYIHKKWMITAANCLYYDGKSASTKQIIFGSSFFRLRVKRIQVHPDFHPSTPRSPVGDLALFELDTEHMFGTYLHQLNLPTEEQCGQMLKSDCATMTSVYGSDVNEFLFGMSSTLGARVSRFPFPRNVIARLIDLDRAPGNADDHVINASFDAKTKGFNHRAGIPTEAGCVSADGSAVVTHQNSAYYLIGVMTPSEKGALGSMSTGESMCHEAEVDAVAVCPYLDWIRLIMTVPHANT